MSNSNYDLAYQFTAKWEGGLSNDKNDRGGITKYGVSIVFLKDLANRKPKLLKELTIPTPINSDTIRNLTKEQAKNLFKAEFWLPPRCSEMPLPVAICVFDCAVNSGAKRSILIAQNAAKDFLNINDAKFVDGKVGPNTLNALNKLNNKAGLQALIDGRLTYYKAIVRNNGSQQVFYKGWVNRANNLLHYVLELI